MPTVNILHILLAGALAIALGGCQGTNKQIPEGAHVEPAHKTAPPYIGPQIVHSNLDDRIATIRYGESLDEGFLIVTNSNGEQTAVLKGLPRETGKLCTADILEGHPHINNRVTQASTAQSEELAKIYRDSENE